MPSLLFPAFLFSRFTPHGSCESVGIGFRGNPLPGGVAPLLRSRGGFPLLGGVAPPPRSRGGFPRNLPRIDKQVGVVRHFVPRPVDRIQGRAVAAVQLDKQRDALLAQPCHEIR